jgi:hypothetical protein
MPAVVHLGEAGHILEVEIPGAGTLYASSIREMFPADITERIFDDLIDYRRLADHLLWRLDHPGEPPLVVLPAAPTP